MKLHVTILETREGASVVLKELIAHAQVGGEISCIPIWSYTRNNPELSFHQLFLELYRRIEGELKARTRSVASDLFVVLFDDCQFKNHLNPIFNDRKVKSDFRGQSSECGSLAAKLILAFPEVAFFFPPSEINLLDAPLQGVDPFDAKLLVDLGKWTCPVIFDSLGLRQRVIECMLSEDNPDSALVSYLPQRRVLSVSLDDEANYAFFTAYAAYRCGARALPLHREKSAFYFLNKRHDFRFDWTFEDIYLGYPDIDNDEKMRISLHVSKLASDRKKAFPNLEKAIVRIFCSTFHGHGAVHKQQSENVAFIKSWRNPIAPRDSFARLVVKPLAGIFDLWHAAKLDRKLRWIDKKGRVKRGTAQDFVWPPEDAQPSSSDEQLGHSSPGTLLLIADLLIRRANELFKGGVHTVPDAVHGAVLASSAFEILGGHTPTTSIEALKLKHQFEMLAECQFSGVEYHLSIRPRLKDIQTEIISLKHWFRRRKQASVALNIEMQILGGILVILRDYGQYDEEQICMNRVRHLNNTLWMRQKPIRYVLWPLLRYLEVLIGSFSLFVLVIALWLTVLSGMYWVFHWGSDYQIVLAVEDAITSFFSIGGPIHHGPDGRTTLTSTMGYAGVICLAVVAGCVHLGIFISHLYSMIARK